MHEVLLHRAIYRHPTARDKESHLAYRQTSTEVDLTGKGAEQRMGEMGKRRRMVPMLN